MNHSKKHKKPPRLETRPSTRTQETQLAMTDQRQKARIKSCMQPGYVRVSVVLCCAKELQSPS